jgi:hypothetical protein
MEKTMSVEERIKRAEEIYNKRKNNYIEEEFFKEKRKRKKSNVFHKLFVQILVCLLIYGAFYVVANDNYIFSEEFRNNAKEILHYDINFQTLYNKGIEKFNSIFGEKNKQVKTEEE